MSDIDSLRLDAETEAYQHKLEQEAGIIIPTSSMSDEDYYISNLKEIQEYAEDIMGEWNGDESDIQKLAVRQADDIIGKCNELIELLSGMGSL